MEFYIVKLLPMVVVSLFFLVGLVGSVVPMVPGVLVVWVGVLVHKLWVGEGSVSWGIFWVLSGMMVVAQVVDFLCTYMGAKWFGATWRGVVGGVVGLVAGMFVVFPGILVGPVVGAVVGELMGGRRVGEAGKAGVGAAVGGLMAFVVKLGIVFFMIGYFYINVGK